MSCKKCKSSPCACADHGLVTPCSYDDCVQPSESCEEVLCAECVAYCGPTFQVTNPADPTDILFNIYTGDRLEEILQRIALYMVDPACADPDEHHSVWHVQVTNVTNDGVKVSWSGIAPQSAGLNVSWSQTSGVWVIANTSGPLTTSDTSLTITDLDPSTVYLFKVTSGTLVEVATLGGFTAGTGYVTGTGVICNGGSGVNLTVDIVASALDLVGTHDTLFGGTGGYTPAADVATTSSGAGVGLTVDIDTNFLTGLVTAVTVNDRGSGYIVGETITITGGNGDATANVATLTGGLITSIIINNAGSEYNPGDVVNIAGGDANATVIVGTTALGGTLCDSVEVQVTTLL